LKIKFKGTESALIIINNYTIMQQTNNALIVVDYQDGFIPKVE